MTTVLSLSDQSYEIYPDLENRSIWLPVIPRGTLIVSKWLGRNAAFLPEEAVKAEKVRREKLGYHEDQSLYSCLHLAMPLLSETPRRCSPAGSAFQGVSCYPLGTRVGHGTRFDFL